MVLRMAIAVLLRLLELSDRWAKCSFAANILANVGAVRHVRTIRRVGGAREGSAGLIATDRIGRAQEGILGGVGEPTSAAFVETTLLDATAFGIGRQQIALTLISHPAVRALEGSTLLLTASVVGRHEKITFGGIRHIALAANMLLTRRLAAFALIASNFLHLALGNPPALWALGDLTGLGTTLLACGAHLIDLLVIQRPAEAALHQSTTRLAAHGVGVSDPKAPVLRSPPEDSTFVKSTGR